MEPIKVTLKPVQHRVTINSNEVGAVSVKTGRRGPPGDSTIPEGGLTGQAPVRVEGDGTEWRHVPTAIEHGDNPGIPRPEADMVIWRGTVEPLNWTDADIWHDTSE